MLRDRETPTKIFKELVDEIAMLMAYEATNDLALEDATVDTPLERTRGTSHQRQEAHARADLARGSRHGRGDLSTRPRCARGAHRTVSRPRHARTGRLLFQSSWRRTGPRFLCARPDVGDRWQRCRRRGVAQAGRRDEDSFHVPRCRTGRRDSDSRPRTPTS